MPANPLIGLCRFSFVGRGDWKAYRRHDFDHTDDAFRQKTAEALYAPERLEKRFFLFQNLLLHTLARQSDPDFTLLVLTSDLMPAAEQTRLRDICAPHPFVRLIISDAPDVNAGFLPVMADLQDEAGQNAVQFRIDDDDCLSTDFIARLRRSAERFADLGTCAFSISRGFVIAKYASDAPRYYQTTLPFNGAGCAVKFGRRDRTIFSFGHFSYQTRFDAFLDNGPPGCIVLRHDTQDSRKMNRDGALPPGHTEIDEATFRAAAAERFALTDIDEILARM